MKGLSFQIQDTKESCTLQISGEITGEDPDCILKELEKIPQLTKKELMLDFKQTTYINSSGISILIQLIQNCTETRIPLQFIGVSSQIYKIFELVGLTELVITQRSS